MCDCVNVGMCLERFYHILTDNTMTTKYLIQSHGNTLAFFVMLTFGKQLFVSFLLIVISQAQYDITKENLQYCLFFKILNLS